MNCKEAAARFANVNIDNFIEHEAKETGKRMLARVRPLTPVRTGNLRRSWKIKAERDRVTISNAASSTDFSFVNSQKKKWTYVPKKTIYASYVEYGHRQTPGRYVPAIGKRLVNNWVEGKFMMTKTVSSIKEQLPRILEKDLRAYLRERGLL